MTSLYTFLDSSSLHTSSVHRNPVPTIAQDAEKFAANTKKAKVTINSRTIDVPEGTSILSAATQLGLYIPTLCTHPRLPTTPGTCRICLVEQGGRLVPA